MNVALDDNTKLEQDLYALVGKYHSLADVMQTGLLVVPCSFWHCAWLTQRLCPGFLTKSLTASKVDCFQPRCPLKLGIHGEERVATSRHQAKVGRLHRGDSGKTKSATYMSERHQSSID